MPHYKNSAPLSNSSYNLHSNFFSKLELSLPRESGANKLRMSKGHRFCEKCGFLFESREARCSVFDRSRRPSRWLVGVWGAKKCVWYLQWLINSTAFKLNPQKLPILLRQLVEYLCEPRGESLRMWQVCRSHELCTTFVFCFYLPLKFRNKIFKKSLVVAPADEKLYVNSLVEKSSCVGPTQTRPRGFQS